MALCFEEIEVYLLLDEDINFCQDTRDCKVPNTVCDIGQCVCTNDLVLDGYYCAEKCLVLKYII